MGTDMYQNFKFQEVLEKPRALRTSYMLQLSLRFFLSCEAQVILSNITGHAANKKPLQLKNAYIQHSAPCGHEC